MKEFCTQLRLDPVKSDCSDFCGVFVVTVAHRIPNVTNEITVLMIILCLLYGPHLVRYIKHHFFTRDIRYTDKNKISTVRDVHDRIHDIRLQR